MDTHKNAPLTPKGREAMVRAVVDDGLSKTAAARQFNTSAKTVARWVERFRAEGVDGCAIAPQDLFHCPAKQRLPHAQPSRLCVGSATPASKSRRRPVCRRRPSAAFYGGGVLQALGTGTGRAGSTI